MTPADTLIPAFRGHLLADTIRREGGYPMSIDTLRECAECVEYFMETRAVDVDARWVMPLQAFDHEGLVAFLLNDLSGATGAGFRELRHLVDKIHAHDAGLAGFIAFVGSRAAQKAVADGCADHRGVALEGSMLAGLYDELRHQTAQLVADCEAEMPGAAA
jgi:hypothetical protein